MGRTPTYKAVAYEHSHGITDYYLGEGVAFSNSIKHAIDSAKSKALENLGRAEHEANDSGVSILAQLYVYKNGKEVINSGY